MAKKRNKDYSYDGVVFDSKEEIEFYIFLVELKKLNFILSFEYQPESFLLIPKASINIVKGKRKNGTDILTTKTLYREHSYTADFKVTVNPETYYSSIFNLDSIKINNNVFYVDVKGSYNNYGGDRIFPIHQKLVYYLFNEHVIKIVPSELFIKLGYVPDKLMYMTNRKEVTIYTKYRGLLPLSKIVNSSTNNTQILEKNINILPAI